MKRQQVMPLPRPNIHDQSRLLGRPLKKVLLHGEPIDPVVPGAHRVAHKGVEVLENLGHRAEELEGVELGLEGVLHEAVQGVRRAAVAGLAEEFGSFHGCADDHLAAVVRVMCVSKSHTTRN